MVDAIAAAATANAQGEEHDDTSHVMPPLKMSAVPAWAMGMALGETIANGMIESNPEFMAGLEESGMDAEDLTNLMQGLMVEVTKTMGEATDFLKELDDDEEGSAAMEIYK